MLSAKPAKKQHFLKPTAKAKNTSKKAGKLVHALNQLNDDENEDEEVLPVVDDDSDRVPLERLQGVPNSFKGVDTRPAWMKKLGKEAAPSAPKSISEEADQQMDAATDQVQESDDADTVRLPKCKGPRLLRPRVSRMLVPLPKPIIKPEASSASSSSPPRPKPPEAPPAKVGAIVPRPPSAPLDVAPRPPSAPPPPGIFLAAAASKPVLPSAPPGLAPSTAKPFPLSPPGLGSPPGLASNDAKSKSPDVMPHLSTPVSPSPSVVTSNETNLLGAVVATPKPSGLAINDAKATDVGIEPGEKIGGVTSKSAALVVAPRVVAAKFAGTTSNSTMQAATSKSAAFIKPTPPPPPPTPPPTPATVPNAQPSEVGTSESTTSNNNTAAQNKRETNRDWNSWQPKRAESAADSEHAKPPPPPPTPATVPNAQPSEVGTSESTTSNNNTAAQNKWETNRDWNSRQPKRAESAAHSEHSHSEHGASEAVAESDKKNFHVLLTKEQALNSSLRMELEGFIEHRNRMQESSAHSQKTVIAHNAKLERRCRDLEEDAAKSNASSRKLEKDYDELRSHLKVQSAANTSQAQHTDASVLLRGELHAAFVDKMALHRRCEEHQNLASNTSELQARCEQLQDELKAKFADSSINANLYKADKEGLEQMWRHSERKATDAILLAEELKARNQQALEAYQIEVRACMFLETRGKGYESIACEQTAAKLRESEFAETLKVAVRVSEERVLKEEQAAKALKRDLKEVEERYRGVESKAKAMVAQTKTSLVEELAEKSKSEQVLQSKMEQDGESLRESLSLQSQLERDVQSLKSSLEAAQDEVRQQERRSQMLANAESEMVSQRCSLHDELSNFEQDERARIREDIARARAEDSVARREVLDKKLAKLHEEKDRRLKEEEASMRGQLDRQITKYQIKLEAQQENYAKARSENTDLRGRLAKADGLAKFYEGAEESVAQKLTVLECQESSSTAIITYSGAQSDAKPPEDQAQLLHRVAVATGNVSAISKENEILERKLDLAIRQRREAFKKVHVLRNAFKLHRAQSEFDVEEQQRFEERMVEVEDRALSAEQAAAKFKKGALQTMAMWNKLLSGGDNGDTDDMDTKDEDGYADGPATNWHDVKIKDKEKDFEEKSIKKQESDDEEEAPSEGTQLEEDNEESPKSSPREDIHVDACEESDEEGEQRAMQVECAPEGHDDSRPNIAFEGEGLTILYKPPGWTCTTSSSKKTYGMQRIQDWIIRVLGARYEYLRNCKDQIYGLAHRLDCDTSGPLILATNANSMTILKRSMQSGHWYKEYLALMHGLIPENRWAGRISYRLNSKFRPGQGQLTTISDRGKRAETHYQAVQFYRRNVGNKVNYYTLVRCRIVTGRTHQIRVHLAALGERLGLRPRGLVGDSKYAFPFSTLRDDNMLCNRIFLHESVLQLPALGDEVVGAEQNRPIKIESPLPYDLRRALGKLEPDTEHNEAVAQFRDFLRKSSRRAVPQGVKRRDVRLESSSIRLVARSGS